MTDRQLLWQSRAAAGGARDHRRAPDRDRLDGRDRDAGGLRRRRRARRQRSTADIQTPSRPGILVREPARDRDGAHLRRLLYLGAQRLLSPWRQAEAAIMSCARRPDRGRSSTSLPVAPRRRDRVHLQRARGCRRRRPGRWPRPGRELLGHPCLDQRRSRSALALAWPLPLGVYLGHRGTGELFAVAIGNAGRAIPELALIAIMVAFIGTGCSTSRSR